MKHILVLLFGGWIIYFLWEYMGNANRVAVSIFLRSHLFKIVLIAGFVFGWFFSQAILGSLKVF